MRDIVATIQPEQDVIVRADVSRSIAVQGAPGTGKTAVGLHRAAYLLYAHREQLRRQGVLVVGPNDSFLRYIQDVLPALGEIEAAQSTIEALVARTLRELNPKWTIRGADRADVATLKGDGRLAAVLERAVWAHVGTPTEGLVLPRGARRFRVATYEAEEVVAGLRARGVRYGAARAMLPQALAHRILVRMELDGDSPDDRVQAAVARSKPVKEYAASAVAGRRPRQARAPPAVRRRRARRRGRRHPHRRRAATAAAGTSPRPPPARRPGPSPTRCCSTRPPTWWSGRRPSATSWSTRRRTCRR